MTDSLKTPLPSNIFDDVDNEQVFDSVAKSEDTPLVSQSPTTEAEMFPQTASMKASVFNLVNSIVGGGVLALPFGFKQVGVFLGLILLCSIGTLSAYSAYLLVRCRQMTLKLGVERKPSYYNIVCVTFGTRGAKLVELFIVLLMLGACVGYIAIIGETLSNSFSGALGYEPWYTHAWVIQLSLLSFVLFPLSMLSTVGALKYTSIIALCGILFLVVCIIVKFASNFEEALQDEDDKFIDYFNWGTNMFASIPIMTFAFSMHMQMFPVWQELKQPTPKRITNIVLAAIVICGVLYAAVGVFGYLTFFDLTHSNILVNYNEDILIELGKIGYCLMICFSFPLMMFPARLSLWSLWCHIARKPTLQETFWTRFVMVLSCSFFCYFVAVAVDNIQIIFGFTGATMGSMLIFIIPGMCKLRLEYLLHRQAADSTWENLLRAWNLKECLPPLLLVISGTAFGVIGVVSLFMEN